MQRTLCLLALLILAFSPRRTLAQPQPGRQASSSDSTADREIRATDAARFNAMTHSDFAALDTLLGADLTLDGFHGVAKAPTHPRIHVQCGAHQRAGNWAWLGNWCGVARRCVRRSASPRRRSRGRAVVCGPRRLIPAHAARTGQFPRARRSNARGAARTHPAVVLGGAPFGICQKYATAIRRQNLKTKRAAPRWISWRCLPRRLCPCCTIFERSRRLRTFSGHARVWSIATLSARKTLARFTIHWNQ